MALDQAKILFKKIIGGVSSTNNDSPYFNEIAGPSPGNVTLNRLWMLSQRIPTVNPFSVTDPDGSTYGANVIPESVNILEKVIIRLYRIQGTGGVTAAYSETVGSVQDAVPVPLNSRRFKDILNSFVYGVDYAMEVRGTSGNVINIFTPENDGYLDADSGIISFYGSSIYNEDFIDVTCFKYIGPKGDEAGLDIYDKLINGSSGNPNTPQGNSITQVTFKCTRVATLPNLGDAYNGLLYLEDDGNNGIVGNPIRFQITFDYGQTWLYHELDPLDDSKRFLTIPTVGSFGNYQILEFQSIDNSFLITSPNRNELFYVQTNLIEVFLQNGTPAGDYTVIDDLYYQYMDGNSNPYLEPKSFEKTSQVEISLAATNVTSGNGSSTGIRLPERSNTEINFIENSLHYTIVEDLAKILNKNSFNLYLNGQKIDIFDSNEEDPVFVGVNPIDSYTDFSAAFGEYSPSFPITLGIEGEQIPSLNSFHIDLTGGLQSETFSPNNSDILINLTSVNPILSINSVIVNGTPFDENIDYTFTGSTVTFNIPFTGSETVVIEYNTDNDVDRFFGVIDGKSRLENDFRIRLYPEDINLIDYNRDYYDDQYIVTNGDSYYLFYIELSDGSNTYYRKIDSYTETVSGNSIDFTYDGTDLTGSGISSVRLIYFKKPNRLTGGETLFWMSERAAYEIEINDEFILNYTGNLEKSVIVKNNLNNFTGLI